MQIPKQAFAKRYKWQVISSAVAVFVIAGLWGALMVGTPYRNTIEIGNVVYDQPVGGLPLEPAGSALLAEVPLIERPRLNAEPSKQIVNLPKKVVTDVSSTLGLKLFVDPIFSQQGYPAPIASQPMSRWFGGWSGDIGGAVDEVATAAASSESVPVLVAYNIPARDCGLYSAGGASAADDYRQWISGFAEGLGQRKAIVVLEPDALAGIECLDGEAQKTRLTLLAEAVTQLKSRTKASVYIDAGNARWITPKTMASRLTAANIGMADGFALNVSNFIATPETQDYGDELAQLTGKRYVIDTSRNGNGAASDSQWCNPWGRALGERPTTQTGQAYVDAYLWVKVPGESDGACNGGPAAGQWWGAYADELIRNAR